MPTFEGFAGTTFVYLAHFPGRFYKIGCSSIPERRFVALRAEAFRSDFFAGAMVLVAYFKGVYEDENRLLRSLSEYRLKPRREYLEDHPEVEKRFFASAGMLCIARTTPQKMSAAYYRALNSD